MNPVIEQMRSHRSIRKFTDEEVAETDIAAAVEAGQMASTSAGIQSYCLIRIRDEQRLDRLVTLTGDQTKVARCGAFFIICGDTRRHRLLAERAGRPYETRLEAFLLSVVDTSLFAQNLALAFESMGYGICCIGGLRNDLPAVQELLELPEGTYPLYGLCVGRPADEPMLRPRLPLQGVLFEEHYPEDGQMLAMLDEFDDTMLEYFRQRGAGDRIWSQEMIEKFTQPRRTATGPFFRSQGANLD